MSVVLDVNGLSIRMRTPYGRRPPARGEAGVSLVAETPVVPTPYSGETDGVLSATASRHPAFMANEFGNRLAGQAGFPSPKGGDIPWALLETPPPSALGRGGGRRERPWRKLSAN
jgi:hypothetical protein